VTYLVAGNSSCPFADVLSLDPKLPINDQIPKSIDVTHLHFQVNEGIKTPYIINPNEKSVNKMMGKFPERLYRVFPGSKEKKLEFRLRPACDYGAWSIFKDAVPRREYYAD